MELVQSCAKPSICNYMVSTMPVDDHDTVTSRHSADYKVRHISSKVSVAIDNVVSLSDTMTFHHDHSKWLMISHQISQHFHGLVQERCSSSALALELTHWSYIFLALTHQYQLYSTLKRIGIPNQLVLTTVLSWTGSKAWQPQLS